jgi:two-component sensor histidine kinase
MRDATNLSLILNEAITNATNHAYLSEKEGIIEIDLKDIEPKYQLTIRDYGCGFDTQKTYGTLGLSLINSLVASLPNSQWDIISHKDQGTTITIIFTGTE